MALMMEWVRNWKWGHPVSELYDKQPEKSSFSCMREARHLSPHSSLQTQHLSFCLLFHHHLMFYWWWPKGSGIDCTSLMAKGERRQRFLKYVSPSVWTVGTLNVFHKYVNLTESRGGGLVYWMVQRVWVGVCVCVLCLRSKFKLQHLIWAVAAALQ